jgi:hypothetical protein
MQIMRATTRVEANRLARAITNVCGVRPHFNHTLAGYVLESDELTPREARGIKRLLDMGVPCNRIDIERVLSLPDGL